MFKFILFEGLDRTGKTTISKAIAKKINAIRLTSPPELLMPFRTHFDNTNDETNFAYYLTGNHILNCQIKEHLKTNHVICDRYFYTTVAYHSSILKKDLSKLLDEMTTIPHKIYYLKGDISILEQRAKKISNLNDKFHNLKVWEEVKDNYDKYFKESPNVLTIDTTNKTEEEVLQIVIDDLKKSGIKS